MSGAPQCCMFGEIENLAMGRRPTKHLNLPPRLRARRQRSGRLFYYYDTGDKPRREIPLGPNFTSAVKQWSELEIDAKPSHLDLITFRRVAERYQKEVIPSKAPRTQKDNLVELSKLFEFFDKPPAPIDKVKPLNVRQYLDWRKDAPIRANREKALFSHIWNKAREWGYTDKPNPCAGIRGYREGGRKIYIEDEVFQAVHDSADQATRHAMDLAYLTGQRPADTLGFRETDIKDDVLLVEQAKTRTKLRLNLKNDKGMKNALGRLIDQIIGSKARHKVRSLYLLCNERGERLTYFALDSRFEKARTAAQALAASAGATALAAEIGQFQFRDLRAKAATDKADDTKDIRAAQKQLGHGSVTMTEHYVRNRRGEKIDPTR
jgi:integrase